MPTVSACFSLQKKDKPVHRSHGERLELELKKRPEHLRVKSERRFWHSCGCQVACLGSPLAWEVFRPTNDPLKAAFGMGVPNQGKLLLFLLSCSQTDELIRANQLGRML